MRTGSLEVKHDELGNYIPYAEGNIRVDNLCNARGGIIDYVKQLQCENANLKVNNEHVRQTSITHAAAHILLEQERLQTVNEFVRKIRQFTFERLDDEDWISLPDIDNIAKELTKDLR